MPLPDVPDPPAPEVPDVPDEPFAASRAQPFARDGWFVALPGLYQVSPSYVTMSPTSYIEEVEKAPWKYQSGAGPGSPGEPAAPLVPELPDVPDEPDGPLVPELPDVPEDPAGPVPPLEPDVPDAIHAYPFHVHELLPNV